MKLIASIAKKLKKYSNAFYLCNISDQNTHYSSITAGIIFRDFVVVIFLRFGFFFISTIAEEELEDRWRVYNRIITKRGYIWPSLWVSNQNEYKWFVNIALQSIVCTWDKYTAYYNEQRQQKEENKNKNENNIKTWLLSRRYRRYFHKGEIGIKAKKNWIFFLLECNLILEITLYFYDFLLWYSCSLFITVLLC